jgi:hypothetical protein
MPLDIHCNLFGFKKKSIFEIIPLSYSDGCETCVHSAEVRHHTPTNITESNSKLFNAAQRDFVY